LEDDDDSLRNIRQTDPKLRLIAIIPVVILAAALLAFMYGFRTEGRKYTTSPWRSHVVAEHDFQITTPGLLMSMYTNMNFDGEQVTAQSYVGSDMGHDFSVTVATRPESDKRSIEDIAKGLGGGAAKPVPRSDGTTAVDTEFVLEGQRNVVRLIFKDRTLYQLMAVGPQKTFPEQQAQRFLASFKLTAP
jgi:hypothetical protein